MNLPNKLTVLRIALVPFFIAAFYLPAAGKGDISYNYFAALMFFGAAALTDALDGHIARSQNLITTFGKFLDPLADKILTTTALIIFVDFGIFSAIPIVIIIAREFMVSGLRLVTAGEGVVVAAGFSGKLKTAVTMAMIVLVLLTKAFALGNWDSILQVMLWISVALTVISGYDYFKAYAPYISTDDILPDFYDDDDEDFEVFDPNKDYSVVDDEDKKSDDKTEKSEDKTDVKKDEKTDVKKDVKTDVKSDVKKDVKTDVKKDVKSDVKKDEKSEDKKDVKADVKKDEKVEVKKDVKADVKVDDKKDVKVEVKKDVKTDVKKDVKPDVKPDVKKEVKADVKSDVKTDVKKDVKTDVKKDVKSDVKDTKSNNKNRTGDVHK